MIDWFFIGLAVALGGQPGGQEMASAGSAEAPSSSAFEAEDQTPTGKFTTATEIKTLCRLPPPLATLSPAALSPATLPPKTPAAR